MKKSGNKNLTEEETALLDSFENSEWQSIMTPERKKELQQVARDTLKQKKGSVELDVNLDQLRDR